MVTKIVDIIDNFQKKIIEVSDKIWKYAELGYKEVNSSTLLAEELKQNGFNVQLGVGEKPHIPTAIVASYGMGHPIIGILGEYDALPGLSQKPIVTKDPLAKGQPGHGCGHNLLGAASFGACLALKQIMEKENLSGTIRFYGCPNEETGDGKAFMVKAGLFDDVDCALTWHPGNFNTVMAYSFQACLSVKFRFHGKTANAAVDPYNGRSGLDAVELMNVGCNYLREHMIPDARLHYVITFGGDAPNIVPAEAEVWYFIRTPNITQAHTLFKRVEKVAQGAALMTETELEIHHLSGSSNILNNMILESLLKRILNELKGPVFNSEDLEFAKELVATFPAGTGEAVLSTFPDEIKNYISKELDQNQNLVDFILPLYGRGITKPGSTDVGDVSWVTPTAQFSTVCAPFGTPGHSWQNVASSGVQIGHKGMIAAAKILGQSAYELMTKPEIVQEARNEFKEKIAKTPYESPIMNGVEIPINL